MSDLQGRQLIAPPIPGVIVIPGDIGFLNQFFNVTLLVGNVAPAGSGLVVTNLRAEIVLPPGVDNVANSDDDPLRMARTQRGESPRVQVVAQAGGDGKLGTGDDIPQLAPGDTGSAEYLVEGRREGTHVLEMQMTGTLNGLPGGPVTITGRAAGAVLVRNPTFTLTFTHPDLVNAGEPYTLDVTVTNTSESPANFVSVNLFPRRISGASLVGSPSREITSIPPGDSATVSFDLVAQVSGPVFAATLVSDDNIDGTLRPEDVGGRAGRAALARLARAAEGDEVPAGRSPQRRARPARQGVVGGHGAGGGAAEGRHALLEEDRLRPRHRAGRGRLPLRPR